MRVLFLYRHFWPDRGPAAKHLRDIPAALAAAGHEVELISGEPHYADLQSAPRPRREQSDGITFLRVPVLQLGGRQFPRALSMLAYALRALVAAARRPRPHWIVAASSPAVLGGVAGMLVARRHRARLLYHCEDINPDAGIHAGVLTEGPVASLLTRLDTATMRRADRVVVLSSDMRDLAIARGIDPDKVIVINNFIPRGETTAAGLDATADTGDSLPAQRPRFLYAGNHGQFQGLDDVLKGVALLRERQVQASFVFIGDGVAKTRLMRQAEALRLDNIRFLPFMSEGNLRPYYDACDVGLVPLHPGVVRCAYPSKAITLLAAGLPILATAEADSELAQTIAQYGLGWVSPPGNPAHLAEALERACGEASTVGDRPRLRAHAEAMFGGERALSRWVAALESPARP